MNLLGPRPLLMEYLSFFSAEQARRHETRHEIIGWAQVNGRNATRWEQKFEYDCGMSITNRCGWILRLFF